MIRALIVTLALVAVACDKPAETPAPVEPAPVAKAEAKPAAEPKLEPKSVAAVQAPAKPAAVKPAPAPAAAGLLDPTKATATAPDTFKVTFQTTKGDFTVEVHRAWAPMGADRFYNLVKVGFFTDVAFFRVISGFMAQFGIHGDPKVSAAWKSARITDDPVDSKVASNTRGRLTFAMAGPNTRSTQFFISFADRNARLDGMGFPPIGEVVDGMNVIDSIHSGYGEGAPRGQGPAQGRLQGEGNAYLKAEFPRLDYIKAAKVL